MGQENHYTPRFDTIFIHADSMILFRDSIVAPTSDTIILVEEGTPYKIKRNTYKKSQDFYDSVYYKTHKRRTSKELYNLALSYRPDDKSAESGKHTIAKNPFEEYQGKTIRNIRFVDVDILEGSVNYTLKQAKSGFSKILNKAHIHTHVWILKKFLLVKPGDKIIPAILADNERVFRQIPAIEDVKIWVVLDTIATDYADLIIVTKDIFSIGATASASSLERFSASIWDNNSLGLAYELGGKFMYDSHFKNPYGYEISSKYRNFLGSFINGTVIWLDAFDSRWLTFNIRRGFLTPQTKYGGGLNVGWVRDKYEFSSGDTLLKGIFETNYEDIWLGRSFLLGDISSRNNLYLSGRFERKEYTDRPYTNADSNASFHNRNIYYAKLGYARYNFYKANMIRS